MAKQLIVKHNDLVTAQYKLQGVQLRIFQLLVASIERKVIRDESGRIIAVTSGEDFYAHTFSVEEITKHLNIEKNNYGYIEDACRNLMTQTLTVRHSNSEVNMTIFGFIEKTDLLFSRGTVTLQINRELKPLLLNTSEGNFLQYPLENANHLISDYSIRIYELLKQHLRFGQRILSAEEINTMFMSNYAPRHIKTRILNPTQKEIQEKTDILFTYTDIYVKRQITGFKFLIFKNEINRAIIKGKYSIDGKRKLREFKKKGCDE